MVRDAKAEASSHLSGAAPCLGRTPQAGSHSPDSSVKETPLELRQANPDICRSLPPPPPPIAQGAALTVQNGQGQDAPSAGPCHPVKEVLGSDARGLLDGDEELDDDQAFHAPSIQAEQVVVAVEGTAVGEKKVQS